MRVHDTNNGSTRSMIIGLLAGGTIGAALALMYAPEKGSRLRARLRRKSRDVIDETKIKIEGAVEATSDRLEHAKENGSKALREAKKTVDAVADKAAHSIRGN